MSDDPRKAQRTMERVFLCNDIWWDCLPFLSRPKIGFEFALVSDRFDGLADAHLNSKKRPWKLGRLRIGREQDNVIIVKNWLSKNEKHLPFPEEPLPNNVIGFEYISISYIDHKVIDFLRRIRRLFQPTKGAFGLKLSFGYFTIRTDYIWPMIDPSAITKLNIYSFITFDSFRRRISPTFLLDWVNVRLISVAFAVPFGDGANEQLLREWIHTPREDGKPKLMRNDGKWDLRSVEYLKTQFRNATTAVSYIIAMEGVQSFVPFAVDNWHTGERLTFRRAIFDMCCLERGPIGGRDAAQWAKWAREASRNERDHNTLYLSCNGNSIGPLTIYEAHAGARGQ